MPIWTKLMTTPMRAETTPTMSSILRAMSVSLDILFPTVLYLLSCAGLAGIQLFLSIKFLEQVVPAFRILDSLLPLVRISHVLSVLLVWRIWPFFNPLSQCGGTNWKSPKRGMNPLLIFRKLLTCDNGALFCQVDEMRVKMSAQKRIKYIVFVSGVITSKSP